MLGFFMLSQPRIVNFVAITLTLFWSSVAIGQDFAARVDGEAIDRENVEQLIARGSNPGYEQELLTEGRIIATQAMIRRLVLVKAAQKARFDQDPAVKHRLSFGEKQALIEAYLSKSFAGGLRPSDAEIDRFVSNNPQIFTQRQTFHYYRLEIPITSTFDEAKLTEVLHLNKNVSEVAQALRRRAVDVRFQSLWQGGEQIEADLLKHLIGMSDGSTKVVEQGNQGRWVLLQRLAAFDDPVDIKATRSAVARGLFAEQQEERFANLIKKLRSEANVQLFVDKNEIAAMVNSSAISKSELDRRLKELGLPDGPNSRQRVLDELIGQLLLVERATQEGIAQQPQLLRRTDELKKASLAAQYLESEASRKALSPSEREIAQFINGRPAFFAERKVFRYEEAVLARSAKDQLEATQKALEGLSRQQIQRWLNESGSVVARNAPWLGPEALPPQLYAALAKMQPGETQVIPLNSGKALSVVTLISIHDDPLDDEQARFVAADILRQQAKAKAAQEIVEKLVSSADIEYAPGYKPKDAVRLTSADWGKRQWAGFSAWTAQFAALVMLLAGTVAFAVKSREQIGFVVPLLNDSGGGGERTWSQESSRSNGFLFLLGMMALALASASSLLQWSVIRTLIVQERIVAGAAAGAFLGLFLSAGVYFLARGEEAKLALGRWTVLLVPAAATALGTALVWSVLGR